jgi:5,6-dimethylbenzimidazole synthase
MPKTSELAPAGPFPPAEREAVYKAIFSRRDVRDQFLPDPVPDKVTRRLLAKPPTAHRQSA